MLIDKAELAAMAIEENQKRVRIHVAYSSPNIPSNQNELAWVLEALEKLNSKIKRTASAQTSEFQQSLTDMKRQFTPRQPGSNRKARDHNLSQPDAFRRASMFCDFHNTYGLHTAENCFTKYQQRNDTCTTCREVVHCHNYYPTIKNPRPLPPSESHHETPQARAAILRGEGKSLNSKTLFDKLRQQEKNQQDSREVVVDLFDISNRPLFCQETVEVNVLVEDERPREPFQQEFIVVLPRNHVAYCPNRPNNLQPEVLEASFPDVAEDVKSSLHNLLLANQHVFAFKTSNLGNTGLVKHVIDTQGLGPIC
ncbi:hypothetical protein OUZ56_008987 [Daphnia magna]|uniref:Uncharacterized protein n=1 Tax=Daphnia magna TaxID=35525 RepID=A0ABR0AEP0_9CRUS|nr:hypothetical protein OUZ56_008987 [Daphnia magna]